MVRALAQLKTDSNRLGLPTEFEIIGPSALMAELEEGNHVHVEDGFLAAAGRSNSADSDRVRWTPSDESEGFVVYVVGLDLTPILVLVPELAV